MSALRLRIHLAISLLLAVLPTASLSAAARPAPTRSAATGSDYMRALAAADRFLQAWQGSDIETGMVMLTGHAKNKMSRDELDRLFSSSAPAAYEIARGKFLRRGRYEFPVVLLNASARKSQRRFSNIIVLNTGDNDWAIDKLP
jgi:hypothetical protein